MKTSTFFVCDKSKYRLVDSSRRESMREDRAELFSMQNAKSRAARVVRTGEKSLLYDPGSELRLGAREKKGQTQ